MSIHEECGVFGVYSEHAEDVASLVYYGLFALQHRGQESCGIVVNGDGLFTSRKGIGLVNDVFTRDEMKKFPLGEIAVGHVRYGTTGGVTISNCQPIQVNHLKGKLAVAHNGNLSNVLTLRRDLEMSGAIFHTTSDTETIGLYRYQGAYHRSLYSRGGKPRHGQAGRRVFFGAYVLYQTDRRPGSTWVSSAVLWPYGGRYLCGRLGKLRPQCGRCKI